MGMDLRPAFSTRGMTGPVGTEAAVYLAIYIFFKTAVLPACLVTMNARTLCKQILRDTK